MSRPAVARAFVARVPGMPRTSCPTPEFAPTQSVSRRQPWYQPSPSDLPSSAMTVPCSMLIPHMNSYRPGSAGVMSIGVRFPVGKNLRMPKSGKTTSSEQLDVSLRSKISRTGRPALTRTSAGEYPPSTVMTTSPGDPPTAGAATATPRDAKKKYQLTQPMAASPAAMTIQSVVLMAPSRDGIPPVGIIYDTPGGYVNRLVRGPRYGLPSCSIGIEEPLTCGIFPSHFFAISYCTRLAVTLRESSSFAFDCASATARIAFA